MLARNDAAAKNGKLRGIGFSAYIEACGLAPSNAVGSLGAGVGQWESAEVRVNPVGSVEVLTGSHSHGQGHETTFAQLVSDRLGIDIPLLKREVEHLIAIHPHVIEFLLFLKHTGKEVWLVTNAHSKTLDLKMKKTRIGPYFDGIISAHQVGLPKEDARFWGKLQDFISYKPERTLLGEDSEVNLATAECFSIRYLVYISRYSSKIEPRQSDHFPTIEYFNTLIPEKGSSCITIPQP